MCTCTNVVSCLADGGIKFQFSIVEEVDHMIDAEYQKPLEFLDIPNQRLAEQLTYKDAVSERLAEQLTYKGAVSERLAEQLTYKGAVTQKTER